LDNVDAPGGSSDFQQELLALRQDPQVRRLARKLAGDLDLAEDLIQTAYYRLAALKHPKRIENVRAYYLRVLRNEATKLYALRQETPWQETPFEDPDSAPAPALPIDERVCNSLQAQSWLKRLADEYDRLLAAVPARSDDPVRYKGVIYTAAEQVLHDGINGEPSAADGNDALRAAYRDYFDQPGTAVNTRHKRFGRAREDVKALLRSVVSHDELI
jgi:DNA-directed RNA polymerase specialized sigma24 family protein